MKWFVAVLVVECRVGREKPTLWDEQIVVLRARNADEAYMAARRAGGEAETSYENDDGRTVRWRFRGLGGLDELGVSAIRSGTEIFSRLSRSEKPYIARKSELWAFKAARVSDRTASELLHAKLKSFAPR